MKPVLHFAVAVVSACLLGAPAEAQTAASDRPGAAGPAGIEKCTGCHGPVGELKGFPRIAEQPAPYLYRQLQAYQNRGRASEGMAQAVNGLSDAQLQAMAEHFAAMRLAPARTSTADKPVSQEVLDRGRVLATQGDDSKRVQSCQNCHGVRGTGLGPYGPYLAGLDAGYMAGTLKEWKAGTRHTDPSGSMAMIARQMDDADIEAVSQYYGAQALPQAAAGESTSWLKAKLQ
jgi:cytochrome c553